MLKSAAGRGHAPQLKWVVIRMVEMTEDRANEICRCVATVANEFINAELTKTFEDSDDRISADLTVKIMLVETALKAFKKVSGVEYARLVRCKQKTSPK